MIAFGAAAALALGGGAWWAADRYLIPHVQVADVSALEAENGTAQAVARRDGTLTADSYASDDASITVTKATTGAGDDVVTYYVAESCC